MGTAIKTPGEDKTINKLFEALQSKQAPAHIGKPIFEKYLEDVKRLGANKPQQWFGKKLRDNDKQTVDVPLNFGSKLSMSGMRKGIGDMEILSEEARLHMFHFKKCISNMEIQAQIKGHTSHPSTELLMSTPAYKRMVQPMCKAFNVTDFAQWIDQVQARFFFEEYEIPYLLADEFDSMPMDSSLVRVPGALGLLEGELEADDGVFTIQSNTQASYIVESKNNVVHSQITQDLLDDSSPAIIDKYRKEIMKGSVRSYERCMLDGQDGGVHFDADYAAGSAKLYVKAWDGLRKKAFVNETLVGGSNIVFAHADSPSKDMFSGLLKRTKCQGVEKSDLVYIIGCTTQHDLVTGAIPELFTAFAFGGLASNVTGITPPVFGIQNVTSQLVREDLEITGLAANPAIGVTTYALIVQKSRVINWVRQATRIFASPSLPSSDLMLMSGKTRHAMGMTPQSSEERSVIMAIDVKTV